MISHQRFGFTWPVIAVMAAFAVVASAESARSIMPDAVEKVGMQLITQHAQIEQWERTNYHQPSDQLDERWNFEGMIQDTQLGFYAGWLIQQADTMPKWNAGDEFEAARKQALAAIP